MNILFPYEKIRNTQENFIKEILNSLETKKNIIAHVPVGVGKTAAIFSSIIPLLLKKDLTLIFLTPRHSQHKLAIETIRSIKAKFNLNLQVSDLIGKKHLCLQEGVEKSTTSEFYEYCKELRDNGACEYYKNYKEKNNQKRVKSFLDTVNPILHIEELKQESRIEKLCPYEIASDLAKSSKIIIADYNHIMNSHIRDTFMKRTERTLSNTILVFDEAHNINKKSRDMLTSTISSYQLELAIKECIQFKANNLSNVLVEIKNKLELLVRNIPIQNSEILIKKEDFKIEDLDQVYLDLQSLAEEIIEEKKRSYLTQILEFIAAWPGQDEGFIRILKKGFLKSGRPIISLNYRCLDPSILIKPIVESSYFSVFMSGTLLPAEMYRDLWGINNTTLLEYKSPFPRENQLNLIVKGITTKFTQRSEEMYKKIALTCSNIINEVNGNSIIFFPSYKFRDEIYPLFEPLSRKTIFQENKKSNKNERDELLDKFRNYKDTGAVLLAVSQGSFGEGIDLIGDFLKAVIIVGIPLNPPDLETKALIDYYEKKYKKGWDYAYIYPAIILSIQNYGRCIRSETDKGIIAFLDERYSWNSYLKCFPKEMHLEITNMPVEKIKKFFTS